MIGSGERPSRATERNRALGGAPAGGAARTSAGDAARTSGLATSALGGASGRPGGSPSRTRAVYVISVAAELAGVHPQTLRIYERRGLLDPARTGGGSRRYSEADIAQLRRIQDLTNAGLNLEGVRRVIELEAEVDRLRQELEDTKREAREAVARTHRQYRRDLVPVRHSPERWLPGRQA